MTTASDLLTTQARLQINSSLRGCNISNITEGAAAFEGPKPENQIPLLQEAEIIFKGGANNQSAIICPGTVLHPIAGRRRALRGCKGQLRNRDVRFLPFGGTVSFFAR